MAKRPPIHPGKILKSAFLDEMQLSAYALARGLRVPPSRITGIVKGECAINADTALRLSRFLGTTPRFWLNLQTHYELTVAERAYAKKIEVEIQPYAATA